MVRSRLVNLLIPVAVFFLGLLAGLNLGTGLAQYSNLSVPYAVWVPRQQAELALFGYFMPEVGNAAILLPALVAFLVPDGRRWVFVLAAFLMAGTTFATVISELPLNAAVHGWNPNATAPAWEVTRAVWLKVLWIKTSLSVLAFTCALIGLRRTSMSAGV